MPRHLPRNQILCGEELEVLAGNDQHVVDAARGPRPPAPRPMRSGSFADAGRTRATSRANETASRAVLSAQVNNRLRSPATPSPSGRTDHVRTGDASGTGRPAVKLVVVTNNSPGVTRRSHAHAERAGGHGPTRGPHRQLPTCDARAGNASETQPARPVEQQRPAATSVQRKVGATSGGWSAPGWRPTSNAPTPRPPPTCGPTRWAAPRQ